MNCLTLKFKNPKIEALYNEIHFNSFKKCIQIVLYGSSLIYFIHIMCFVF